MSSYYSIQSIENILYKDKASKFIGFAYPVKEEASVKEKLEVLKALHPKATHHCYAYRLGLDKNHYRANDDGEPNGTAGKPILGQIDSFGITNCLLVVVRYFGGTKLGVSGLIDAYKECARQTLSATVITEHTISDYYAVKCTYEAINKIYRLANNYKANIIEQQLDNQSSFLISIEQDKSKAFEIKLKEEQFTVDFVGSK